MILGKVLVYPGLRDGILVVSLGTENLHRHQMYTDSCRPLKTDFLSRAVGSQVGNAANILKVLALELDSLESDQSTDMLTCHMTPGCCLDLYKDLFSCLENWCKNSTYIIRLW